MASPGAGASPNSKPLDLEITVVSAKHLKNVNWRNGDLKPYAVAYVDPDRRSATKPDDSGSTKPIWNERLIVPIPSLVDSSSLFLTIDIFHSKPSETPKPLVATARLPFKDLINGGLHNPNPEPSIRTLGLRRPSGRPQGKLRIKVALRERPLPPPSPSPSPPEPNYQIPYYYSSIPTPPPRDYRTFSSPPPPVPVPHYTNPIPPPQSQYPYPNYSDPYSPYYSSGFYSAPPAPAPPLRPYYDRVGGYGGPSAPVDYGSSYEQKAKGGRMGVGAGLAVGAVSGALGALALEEGVKYEEEKIAERVEGDVGARDDYNDYRGDY